MGSTYSAVCLSKYISGPHLLNTIRFPSGLSRISIRPKWKAADKPSLIFAHVNGERVNIDSDQVGNNPSTWCEDTKLSNIIDGCVITVVPDCRCEGWSINITEACAS